MAVPVVLADDYVDVDELVSKYHRRKSTLLFLIAALAMIFVGTLGGYTMLQYTTAKNEVYQNTVVEFAKVTVESPKCQNAPDDPICIKAEAALGAHFKTGNGANPNSDYTLARSYNLYQDYGALSIAVLLAQPLILRLQ